MSQTDFQDEPPLSPALTSYDRKHMALFIRLLDAERDGASWQEATHILFGIDAATDPERAERVHTSHLARAKWMMTTGYPLLVKEGLARR